MPSKITRAIIFVFFIGAISLQAQEDSISGKRIEVYGSIMVDLGYNFNQIDPDWFDVIRTTRLPSYENEFGTDGNVYFGVRQSRLGIKSYLPTRLGELKTVFG